MKLIIAEKPVLAKQIAAGIPGRDQTTDNSIEKGEYVITWVFGHMLELLDPQDYDEAYAKWNIESLPIYFPDWKVKPTANVRKIARLSYIKKMMDESECVIHAGDPDDEGQLLIDEVVRYYNYKKPVYRLDTNDTTAKGIAKALAHLTPNSESERLGWAAYARSVSDKTFGVNMSRLFSCLNHAKLPIGRVQTPTLGLVIARDEMIENHVKVTYYDIYADVEIDGQVVRCLYQPADEDPNLTDGKILSPAYAKTRVDMLKDEAYNGIITEKLTTEQPPLPVDLVELQTQAGHRYKYSPQEVIDITQSLRDNYQAITYNRSECRYLHETQYDEAKDAMETVIKNIRFKPKELDMSIKSRAFNDEKTKKAAHTAIIPQNTSADLSKMTEREKNVYLIIAQFYMSQFLPAAKKRKKKLEIQLPDGGKLTATSTVVTEPGYLQIFRGDKGESDDKTLDKVSAGTHKVKVVDVNSEEKETRPPARYTQTTLNTDMAHVAKYVTDPKVKEILLKKDEGKEGANGSIGTGATRGKIIVKLIEHGYLAEDDKKRLTSTPKARALIAILPDEAKKPDLTARWWSIQDDIKDGTSGYSALTDDVLGMLKVFLGRTYPPIDPKVLPQRKGGEENVVGTCPVCGKPVAEYPKFFGCTDWKGKDKDDPRCGFKIWKSPAGSTFQHITITEANAKALLKGKTIKKKNLVSKAGKSFEANLTLKVEGKGNDVNTHYEFSFDDTKKKKGRKES